MEFNTDRNTEEVENIAAAENDVGQRLDIYLAAKLEVSRSKNFWRKGVYFVEQKCLKPTIKLRPAMCSQLCCQSRNF